MKDIKFKHFIAKEIRPGIFLYQFKEHYEMAMHFLRYQEFYESPSPKFRGQSFSIFEYMKWQSKSQGNGAFNYMTLWSGFNLPADIFNEARGVGIPDPNQYDAQMMLAHDLIAQRRKNKRNEEKTSLFMLSAPCRKAHWRMKSRMGCGTSIQSIRPRCGDASPHYPKT